MEFWNTCSMGHTLRRRRCIVTVTEIPKLGISGLEDSLMGRMKRYIGTLFLTAALVAPAVIVAEAKAQEASVQVRVYDRDHRDYHNWDDHEDHAYRRYLTARHRTYRAYN